MITEDKIAATSGTGLFSAVPMFAAYPIGKAAAQHIEISKAAQDDVLTGSQEIFDRWCDRRRKTAEALATLGQEALQARTPQDFLQVWVHWSKGAMDRLLEDAKDNIAAGATVARNVAGGSTAAAMTWMSKPEATKAEDATDHAHGTPSPRLKGDVKPLKEARH